MRWAQLCRSMALPCGRTAGCAGEIVWSRPPDAEVKPAEMMIGRRRGQQSPVPEESTYKPSNRCAGKAGIVRLSLWFLPRALLHARGPRVSADTRPSLRPLFKEGHRTIITRARNVPRDRDDMLFDIHIRTPRA